MSAENIVLTADRAQALAQSMVDGQQQRQTVFWLALWCAALVHAAVVLEVARTTPRYLGDPGGSPDAIDVELIDASQLPGAAGAPAPANASAPPAEQGEPEAPASEVPPSKTPPSEAAPSKTPPSEAPPSQTAPAPKTVLAEKLSTLLPLDAEEPQAPMPKQQPRPQPSPADAAARPAPPKAAEREGASPKPAAKRALKPPGQLDLSVPLSLTMQGSSDGASSATRPPGITRSGENDRFGRDVIRALRKTMPPQRDSKGRVTVRIFLNERGNIAKIQLVQSSGDPFLAQNVIFSARQASFPFPPKGATLADRTFLVIYTYR